jgi:glutamate N-acetyltransferase/amino-acid N-acetyltransferase
MPEIPLGFRLAGRHCGIKQNPAREDVVLIVSDTACTAASVYTTNHVVAAPVVLDRQRTPSDDIRLVVINSGNANACTGPQGLRDAEEMTRVAAAVCDVRPDQALVLSTGIIGEMLPMDRVRGGIEAVAGQLARDAVAVQSAARGMMTTDTRPKVASRSVSLPGQTVRILGLAKGSGMIGPNMATMLCVLLTDAGLSLTPAHDLLSAAVATSFNCVSVDGHTSTNDTVLLLASGQAGPQLGDAALGEFRTALTDVCVDLARMVADDGEGATHLVEVVVTGAGSDADARRIAATIANSPLVKTAIAGADPNWGRIVSAAGYAGPAFDAEQASLKVNGLALFARGVPLPFDAAAASALIRDRHETMIELVVGQGRGAARFWTCDLTAEYVRINADYHT